METVFGFTEAEVTFRKGGFCNEHNFMEHFSTRYPDLYDLFQNGTARAADLLSDGTVKKGKEGFHDAAYVVDVLYHQERKCAYAVAI